MKNMRSLTTVPNPHCYTVSCVDGILELCRTKRKEETHNPFLLCSAKRLILRVSLFTPKLAA